MKKSLKLGMTVVAAASFVSCGKLVDVPPAHVGKIKLASGIQEELKYPSTFRLPPALTVRNELILVETSHFAINEDIKLFMPQDKLNLSFDVRGTLFISPDQSAEIFEKLTARRVGNNSRVSLIAANDVYEIYGKQLVRSKVRSIMSEYTIEDVMNKRSEINDQLAKEISDLFKAKKYPLGVIQFGLADIQYPEVIVKAQELAKEREVAIATAEAQKMVSLKEAEAALEVAKKQQEIDLIEAETQVLVENKMSEAVSEAFVTQRALKILDKMADNPSKTFVLPMEAFQKPEMLMGVYNNMFNAGRVSLDTSASSDSN
ncbi:MAG: SPFH domain-containing protein [Verrucomicrobiota bacterium]